LNALLRDNRRRLGGISREHAVLHERGKPWIKHRNLGSPFFFSAESLLIHAMSNIKTRKVKEKKEKEI
jgi:hypothetical protein